MEDKFSDDSSSFVLSSNAKVEPGPVYQSSSSHGDGVTVVTEPVIGHYGNGMYQHDLIQDYTGTDIEAVGVIASSCTQSNDTVDDSKSQMNIDPDVVLDPEMKEDGLDEQVSITIKFTDDSNGMSQDSMNKGTDRLEIKTIDENAELSMNFGANYLVRNSEIKHEYSDVDFTDNSGQNIDTGFVNDNQIFPLPTTATSIQPLNHDTHKELVAEDEKIWHCVSCGRCFGTKKVLDEHLQCHGDKKLYFCTQKTYGTLKPSAIIGNEERDNNVDAIGTDILSCYDCEERMKVFSKDRIKELSNDIEACKFCGKIFAGLVNVRRHESLHKVKDPTQSKRAKSTCGNCGRKYSSIANCYRHVVEMHANGPSRFECPHCQRFARRYSDAVQHVNIHHPRYRVHGPASKSEPQNLHKVAMKSNSCSSISDKTANHIISVTNSAKITAPLSGFKASKKTGAPKARRKRRPLTLKRKRFTLNAKSNYTGICTRRTVFPPRKEVNQVNNIPSIDNSTPELQTHSQLNKQTKSDILSTIPSRTNNTSSIDISSSPMRLSSAHNEAKSFSEEHVTPSSTLGQPLEYLCRRLDNGIVIEISREIITRVIIQMEDGTMHQEEFRRPL